MRIAGEAEPEVAHSGPLSPPNCLSYTSSLKAADTLMPRVSVIMNVRNGASFLREALDSVLAQTFQDWELIVWDDRSTDSSASIVGEYHDPRIQYFLSSQ